MRAVVQRVSQAAVAVDGAVVSSIGRGACVLVGVEVGDTEADAVWMANKLLQLRVFDDAEGKRWGCGVKELGYELLCVSQFTLYSVLKGNKPDFRKAMAGPKAKQFYDDFLQRLRSDYEPGKIQEGVFGAMMDVSLTNDGPVTIILDSPRREPKQPKDKTAAAPNGSAPASGH